MKINLIIITLLSFIIVISVVSASPYCYNSYHQSYPEIHIQYDQYYSSNSYPSRVIQLEDSPSCYLGCDVYPRQYQSNYGRMMQEPMRFVPIPKGMQQMMPSRYSNDWHLGVFRGHLI